MVSQFFVPLGKIADNGKTIKIIAFDCKLSSQVIINNISPLDNTYDNLPIYKTQDNIITVIAKASTGYYFYLNGEIDYQPLDNIIKLVQQENCTLGNCKICKAGKSDAYIALLKGKLFEYKKNITLDLGNLPVLELSKSKSYSDKCFYMLEITEYTDGMKDANQKHFYHNITKAKAEFNKRVSEWKRKGEISGRDISNEQLSPDIWIYELWSKENQDNIYTRITLEIADFDD